MILNAGSTFLCPCNTPQTAHLYIILLDPDSNDQTVVVNFTSARSHSDTTCCLDVGEHPFIRHPTVINYFDAVISRVSPIEEALTRRLAILHTPCSPEILAKIRKGLLASTYTPGKIKIYYENRMNS